MFSLEWGGGAGGAVQCISLYAKNIRLDPQTLVNFY